MKITSLIENNTRCGAETAHGLALHVETPHHKILFDVGPKIDTLVHNAERHTIDLTQVDTVIISHGHYDHGGALSEFLKINTTAKVYIQRCAFGNHLSHRPSGVTYIGLDRELMSHPQVSLLEGDHTIDDELRLFTVNDSSRCRSAANASLYCDDELDHFHHEQNLLIGGEVLMMGCGHNGIVNIMAHIATTTIPRVCIGGFHLYNNSAKRAEPTELLDQIISELRQYSTEFYTCHCTGVEVYEYLHLKMPNIEYLYCGETITL